MKRNQLIYTIVIAFIIVFGISTGAQSRHIPYNESDKSQGGEIAKGNRAVEIPFSYDEESSYIVLAESKITSRVRHRPNWKRRYGYSHRGWDRYRYKSRYYYRDRYDRDYDWYRYKRRAYYSRGYDGRYREKYRTRAYKRYYNRRYCD